MFFGNNALGLSTISRISRNRRNRNQFNLDIYLKQDNPKKEICNE